MGKFDSIPYGLYKDDNKGFRHSIDKLIIDYELIWIDFATFCNRFTSASGFRLESDRNKVGYNSWFDKSPSSTYGWFRSSFWFPHCNVKYGLYYRPRNMSREAVSDDGESNYNRSVIWNEKKIIRVEFNPNKIYKDPLLKCLLECIRWNCKIGLLIESDYAVDVPLTTNDIFCNSRSTKVVYDDSRYYGKRHIAGRIKIYNKSKEIKDKEKVKINHTISRCESTFRVNELARFDSITTYSNPSGIDNLSNNLHTIAQLVMYASSFGESANDLIHRYIPDKRNRDKIINSIFGNDGEYVLCMEIFIDLLMQYANMYGFWYVFRGVSDEYITYNCPFNAIEKGLDKNADCS